MIPKETVELTAGHTRLALAPWIGGGISAFTWRGQDVFRPASPECLAADDPLGLSSFPMVPFAGRIAGGRFAFDGRDIALPANLEGETQAIHGQGWRAPWRLASRAKDAAALVFDHAADAWPWVYRAEQVFQIVDGAMTQTLHVTNLDTRPMPAGLGVHPYLPRDPDTRLSAKVSGVFIDGAGPPVAPPAAWDWRDNPTLPDFVDNAFSGWSGMARIVWPSRDLSLTVTAAPATPHMVVYAPRSHEVFCLEPTSHQLDAVNRSAGGSNHGMAVLAPGASASLTVRFGVKTAN